MNVSRSQGEKDSQFLFHADFKYIDAVNMFLYITFEKIQSSAGQIGMTCKLTSLQTNMVPKMTCSPSKKLSPMMMTVAPPVVQPSLGLMALIQGAAASRNTTGPIWEEGEK